MRLSEEYKRQSIWRDWPPFIKTLSIDKHNTLLDLGCGIGTVTKMLSKNASHVIGIDFNHELIQEAEQINLAENIEYKISNLKNINELNLPKVDGIWTSFVTAYFPDLNPLLNNWLNLLKSDGWIAIVEMSDLFGHSPLSQTTQNIFKEYYKRQCLKNIYDFEMGCKVKNYLIDCGLSIIHEENKFDKELTFNGPAESQILKAWENRFARMNAFKEYLGEYNFLKIKREFLDCLSNNNHESKTIVKYIIAKK